MKRAQFSLVNSLPRLAVQQVSHINPYRETGNLLKCVREQLLNTLSTGHHNRKARAQKGIFIWWEEAAVMHFPSQACFVPACRFWDKPLSHSVPVKGSSRLDGLNMEELGIHTNRRAVLSSVSLSLPGWTSRFWKIYHSSALAVRALNATSLLTAVVSWFTIVGIDLRHCRSQPWAWQWWVKERCGWDYQACQKGRRRSSLMLQWSRKLFSGLLWQICDSSVTFARNIKRLLMLPQEAQYSTQVWDSQP